MVERRHHKYSILQSQPIGGAQLAIRGVQIGRIHQEEVGIDHAWHFLLLGEKAHLRIDWNEPHVRALPFHCHDQMILFKLRDDHRGFFIVNDKGTFPPYLTLLHLVVEVDGRGYVFHEASSITVFGRTIDGHLLGDMEKCDETVECRVLRQYVGSVQPCYLGDGLLVKLRKQKVNLVPVEPFDYLIPLYLTTVMLYRLNSTSHIIP